MSRVSVEQNVQGDWQTDLKEIHVLRGLLFKMKGVFRWRYLWSRLYHFEDSKVPPTENPFHLEKQAVQYVDFFQIGLQVSLHVLFNADAWHHSYEESSFVWIACIFFSLPKACRSYYLTQLRAKFFWGSYACPGHLLEIIIDVNFWTTEFRLANFKTSKLFSEYEILRGVQSYV